MNCEMTFFSILKKSHKNEIHIYTDGLKTDTSAAFAAASEREIIAKKRLPKEASIFTAELNAIIAALKWIEEKDNLRKHTLSSPTQKAHWKHLETLITH